MTGNDVIGEFPNFGATFILQIFILAPWLPGFGRIDGQPIFIVLKKIPGDGYQSFGSFDKDGYAPVVMSRRVNDGNVFIHDVLFLKKLQKMIALHHVVAADERGVGKEIHVTDVIHIGVRQDDEVDVFWVQTLGLQLLEDQRLISGNAKVHNAILQRTNKGNGPAGALACIPLPPGIPGLKDDDGS